jgi:hypothetical protein
MAKVRNMQPVEVVITNAGVTEFSLPQDEIISGKQIVAIEAFTATEMPKTPSGASSLSDSAGNDCFVSFGAGQNTPINKMPLRSLVRSKNNGMIPEFDTRIDTQKCKLKFSQTTNLVVDQVLTLFVYFE